MALPIFNQPALVRKERKKKCPVSQSVGNMWLIDTSTLELKSFVGPPDRYAILSHVWTSNQEVSFQEFHRL